MSHPLQVKVANNPDSKSAFSQPSYSVRERWFIEPRRRPISLPILLPSRWLYRLLCVLMCRKWMLVIFLSIHLTSSTLLILVKQTNQRERIGTVSTVLRRRISLYTTFHPRMVTKTWFVCLRGSERYWVRRWLMFIDYNTGSSRPHEREESRVRFRQLLNKERGRDSYSRNESFDSRRACANGSGEETETMPYLLVNSGE